MGGSVKISVGTTNLRPMWVVATILNEMDVQHPIGKLLVEIAKGD